MVHWIDPLEVAYDPSGHTVQVCAPYSEFEYVPGGHDFGALENI